MRDQARLELAHIDSLPGDDLDAKVPELFAQVCTHGGVTGYERLVCTDEHDSLPWVLRLHFACELDAHGSATARPR